MKENVIRIWSFFFGLSFLMVAIGAWSIIPFIVTIIIGIIIAILK